MGMMSEIQIKRSEYLAEGYLNKNIFVCTNCKDVVISENLECPKCGKEFEPKKDLASFYGRKKK